MIARQFFCMWLTAMSAVTWVVCMVSPWWVGIPSIMGLALLTIIANRNHLE